MTPHDVSGMFVALGLLLLSARLLGELVRKVGQPAVLGEIAAGVLLGPTAFGRLAPDAFALLFPTTGPKATALEGIGHVAVALFLMVAGMEVHMGTIWRQGKVAIAVSLSGIVVPFALGLLSATALPHVLGRPPDVDPHIFALFFATALSISAMAVIAKTLMDIGLFRSDLGMTIMAAAIFEDFIGWTIFALILGLIGDKQHTLPIAAILGLTVGFAALMLTVGRRLINALLLQLHAHASWPGGILGATLALGFFGAAFTSWVGVHAVFGAFIVGVAMGDSCHLRERTRATIDQFVSFIFAPIFFATIGLKVDFIAHFNPATVALVLLLASLGKVGGCSAGARLAGLAPRQALALGFGMNARGSMEIILGVLGMAYGLIDAQLFVALVVMTVVTASISGPAMQRMLAVHVAEPFTHYVKEAGFIRALKAQTAVAAIDELSAAAAPLAGLPQDLVRHAVVRREAMMPTGIGGGVAIPHARLPSLNRATVVVGISQEGIKFGGPDGRPAHLIFLLLTPKSQSEAQLEIIADISATFGHKKLLQAALAAGDYTEFLALCRTKEVQINRSD